MKLKQLVVGAMLSTMALGASANSVFEEPSDAIEYRQAAFSMIRVQIGDMGEIGMFADLDGNVIGLWTKK